MAVTRSLALWSLRRLMRLYFRRVELVGVPSPDVTGRLFAANHYNGLVDPILVLVNVPFAASPVAKSTLWKIPGLRWLLDVAEAVPVLRKQDVPAEKAGEAFDNDATFSRVAKHLAAGGNLLIFPEGISHHEPKLQKLKTGAARMLVRAQTEGAKGLSYQAVALEFDAPETFRSDVLVLFGPVRVLDDGHDGSEVAQPAADLAKAITEQIEQDLSELLVEGRTWDERRAVVLLAQMLANESPPDPGDSAPNSLLRRNELGRAIESAQRILSLEHADLVDEVTQQVLAYDAKLSAAQTTDAAVEFLSSQLRRIEHVPPLLGLEDHAVATRRRNTWIRLLLPVGILGCVLYFVPYQAPKLARRLAKGELDLVSTYKLGIGLVAFPVWLAILLAVPLVILPMKWAFLVWFVVLCIPWPTLLWLDLRERERPLRRFQRLGRANDTSSVSDLQATRSRLLTTVARLQAKVAQLAADD